MTEPSLLSEEDVATAIESHGGDLPHGLHAISYSRLAQYQKCGEAYLKQYIEKAPIEPQGAAIAGSLVHSIIEEMVVDGWFRRADIVEEEGARQFFERFAPALEAEGAKPVYHGDIVVDYEGVRWGGRKHALRDEHDKIVRQADGKAIMVGENYPWFLKTAPTWLKRAGTILRDDEANGRQVVEANMEMGVAAWLVKDETLITGRIDQMLLEGPEGPALRDFKTGSFPANKMQLANYAWLLGQTLDESVRLDINYGEMIYLRGATKDKWVKGYDLKPLKPLVPRMFLDMLKGVEAGVFPLTPSNLCGSCWVRASCPYGVTLEV